MFETIKLIHKISVILFLLIYFIKTILLISSNNLVIQKVVEQNKNESINDKRFYWSPLSIISIILLIFSIISLFLPWVKASSSASGFGQSISWSSNSIPAIITIEGEIAFLLLICSGVFLFKRKHLASILSFLSLLATLLLVFKLYKTGATYSSSYGSAKTEFKFEFGSITFLASTILYTLFVSIFVDEGKLDEKLTKALKVPEMIVSALFLLTGIYLLTQIPEIKPLMIVKVGLVFLSIPIAVIGFKKKNKILGALSLLMITASYGLAEIAAKNKAKVSEQSVSVDGKIDGKLIYTDNCALCHGSDGKLGMAGSADLSITQLDTTAIANVILAGKGNMKKVEGLTEEQAKATAIYVKTMLSK